MQLRHFLSLNDLNREELCGLLQRAAELKRHPDPSYQPLKNQVLAMIFEKSSTRTRVSFEVAMVQFGGSAIFLSPRDTQLGRGETVEDSARVISRMVNAVMLRVFEHATVERFAANSRVPVINGLTDLYHPCQLLADLQTFYEHRGDITGKTVAWIGDGNNMCHSFVQAAQLLDFQLHIATPPEYQPMPEILAKSNAAVRLFTDPRAAVRGAHLVVTDVWASMGQEEEQTVRRHAFEPFQVNAELMALAAPDGLFMHCLPAHRGEEVTNEVIDGPQSVVWDEAENRLHAQKALLELLLAK